MSFVYPYFLIALVSVAIPIVVHLFYFRRHKTVYFTNVRFLKEVKEESHARQRLRNLLVLLARCLAVVFLVLAFAQPFIPAKNAQHDTGRREVSIYVDNSFSMQALSEDVPLLEKAKQRAMEIVEGHHPDDRFQILTTDFEGRDQRLISREDALARIGEIAVSPTVHTVSQVMARQKQALALGEAKTKDAYLVSDFQRNALDLQAPPDSGIRVSPVVLQAVAGRNLAVDSVWFEAPVQIPNQTNLLIVKVRNYGDTDAENVRVSLTLDGQTKPCGILNVPANSEAHDTVNVTILRTGWHAATASVSDYPVSFDDNYFFVFNVKESLDILQIFGAAPNRNIEAAFRANSYFRHEALSFGKLDYSRLPEYELIVLADLPTVSSGLSAELAQYVKNGGNLLVFPAHNADLSAYNALCDALRANRYGAFDPTVRTAASLNYDEFVFRDVFEQRRDNLKLPTTKGNFKLLRTADSREEELVRYRDGGALLVKNSVERGNLYLCAAPLDGQWSDLSRHGEVFVPMLYRMGLARGFHAPLAYFIGRDNVIETPFVAGTNERVFKLKGSGEEFIPEQKIVGSKLFLTVNRSVREAGFYDLMRTEGEVSDRFAFNYDRRESQMSFAAREDLERVFGPDQAPIDGSRATDFRHLIGERSRGTPLWKWCVALVLVFLAVETALLRLWKS
jgi:hypothetical protein